tara:strand:+ start:2538 stop:2735 length:198 start_codon:yes stop_codon:yes gene_type:complete
MTWKVASRTMIEDSISEIIYIKDSKVSCDGGSTGHPLVYLVVPDEGGIECPYCSRTFKINKNHKN